MKPSDLDPNSSVPGFGDLVRRIDEDTSLTKIGLFAAAALVLMGRLYFLAIGNSGTPGATLESVTLPGR